VWRVGLMLGVVFWSSLVHAEVYKCPDGKGGSVFRDAPCSAGMEEPVVRTPQSPRRVRGVWAMRGGHDKLTDEQSCSLFSPQSYVVTTHREIASVHIALGMTTDHMLLVTLVSASAGSQRSFHNDIHGLGLRVDEHPFMPVDVKGNAAVLAFLPERSQQLLPQLQTGTLAKFRVRFWPYEQTFDGEISLEGFAEGYEALQRCEAGK
jgi:hypothetical protein